MASLPAARHLARLVGTSDSRKALRVGAQIYINFMSLTRRSGWLQGHISKQAARDPTKADRARRALLTAAERHLTFADLFSGRGARAVPTRDISVMWCADLLRPQSSIAGRLEDPNSTAWYDHQQHPVWKSKFYGAFVLNRRVDLHAIDATPARWRGDAGSSPLDRTRTAASSPRNDLVKNTPDGLVDFHTGTCSASPAAPPAARVRSLAGAS